MLVSSQVSFPLTSAFRLAAFTSANPNSSAIVAHNSHSSAISIPTMPRVVFTPSET
ncbi:hypothetical protein WAI453_010230 [Rhynchosporium graminicola]